MAANLGAPFVRLGRDRCCAVGTGTARVSCLITFAAGLITGHGTPTDGTRGWMQAVELGAGWWRGRGASTRGTLGLMSLSRPVEEELMGDRKWWNWDLAGGKAGTSTRTGDELRVAERRAPPPGRSTSEL